MQTQIVAYDVSKRVLMAIVNAFPDPGTTVITGIEITRDSRGHIRVDVRHISEQRTDLNDQLADLVMLRSAVSDALRPWRHTVRTIEIVH